MLATQRQLLRGIATGMAFLHAQTPRPLLHHDLKSDNVLVWPEEGGFHPKLSDFGLATGTGGSTMRTTRTIVTPVPHIQKYNICRPP